MTQGLAVGRSLVALALAGVLAGCSMAQQGSLIRVRKAVNSQDYQECLELVDHADSYRGMPEDGRAQIAFYRGICLESLQRKPEAAAVYQALVQQHPDSDWAAQARSRAARLQ